MYLPVPNCEQMKKSFEASLKSTWMESVGFFLRQCINNVFACAKLWTNEKISWSFPQIYMNGKCFKAMY